MAEFWKDGWQEDAFGRLRGFIQSSPAWYENLSPSDVAEDAYLLGVASTLFLRDEDAEAKASPAPSSAAREAMKLAPLGVPPFTYERSLVAGGDAPASYAGAAQGRFGSLHEEAARLAGSQERWVAALDALRRAGALRAEWPEEEPLHAPPVATFGEDMRACTHAVLRKALYAFKIGFGLWGRWESP